MAGLGVEVFFFGGGILARSCLNSEICGTCAPGADRANALQGTTEGGKAVSRQKWKTKRQAQQGTRESAS